MPGEPAPRDRKGTSVTVAPPSAPIDAAQAAKITAAALAVIALAFALWYAQTAILLTFAGILLAIVLYGASRALAELTGLPRLLMLALVTMVAAVGLVLAAWTAGPTLMKQIAQLAQSIAAGAATLTTRLASFVDRTAFLENLDLVQLLGNFMSQWGIATGATSVAFSIFGLFSAGLIVLFFGVYLAADPHTYVNLVARLAPEERRQSALEPLIQARAVSMPPAVVILNQLVFGAVFGLVGLALATPLAAAATVPLRRVFDIGEDDNQGAGSA